MTTENTRRPGCRARRAHYPHRQSDQREDGKDHCGPEVQRLVQHPKYRRVVRISKKFLRARRKPPGQDRRHGAHRGSRPFIEVKRWRLKEVLTRDASAS